MVLRCDPLTQQAEHSGGQGSIPGRTPPLEHHDMGLWTQATFAFLVLGAEIHNFTFTACSEFRKNWYNNYIHDAVA